MMSPCGSATRPSTRRSTFKAAVRSSGSWSAACAEDGRYGCRGRGRGRRHRRASAPETLISQRPPEVADRAVPGHWEGDLLIGLQRSAIGTLVERSSQVHDCHPPPARGWLRRDPADQNGPAWPAMAALTMAGALAQTITTLPEQLRRSLTWDQRTVGACGVFVDTGVQVYFADPNRPGSAAAMRTLTACYANTSRREPIYPAGAQRKSQRSLTPSTPDHAKPSDGALRPKHSTTTYTRNIKPVLRRPIESSQVPDRRPQRRIDERPRHRSDERPDRDLPQRNSEGAECVGGQRIGDAGDEPLTDDCPQSAPFDQPVQTVGAIRAEECPRALLPARRR